MNFPKKIMKTSELKALGFTGSQLRTLKATKGQTFTYQFCEGGALIWDTDKLQRFLDRNVAAN